MVKEGKIVPPAGRVGMVDLWHEAQYRSEEAKAVAAGKAPGRVLGRGDRAPPEGSNPKGEAPMDEGTSTATAFLKQIAKHPEADDTD